MAGSIYEFGEFRLDCGRFELLRDGRSLKLERKPMELLILLAESNGQLVVRTEIAKRLWDSEVFVDTEHGINTAIRKIRQVLRDDSEEPRYIQTVTGMGYRFVAALTVVEFPAAAETPSPPVAEASDSEAVDTPGLSPVKSEPEALPSKPLSVRVATLTGYLALTAFFVFIAVGVKPLRDRLLHRGTQPAVTSIAVLPLENLSGDSGQEYFADGITDELTTMLAKNSTLRVTSRTSTMQYKGVHKPLPEIARALGVDGILEGSVARSSGQVHMTLQLIRADTDTHLWAESYDRDNQNVAALPEEAARDIAARLNSSAGSTTPARYVNPDAHDAYLRGHYYWMVGRNEDAGKAFKQAVQIQPDYALGWAGLCEYYGVGVYEGELNPLEAGPQAEAAGRKAVELDNGLAQAHFVLGGAILISRWDAVEALHELTRATDLDPRSSEAYHLRAKTLCALGRNSDAIAIQKQSSAIDPIEHPGAMAEIYLCTREFDEALSEGRLRVQDFPMAPDVLTYLADTYHWKHMDKEAAEMLARELTSEGNSQLAGAVRQAFESGGYPAVVRCELAYWEKKVQSSYVSPMSIARLHALLEEHDKTLALLDESLRKRDPLLLWIQTDPAFDFLHADPRYRSLIQRIGLPPAY